MTLVFFRAPGLKEALQMLYAMAGGYAVDPGIGYLLLSGTVFPKAFPLAELGIAVALVTFAPASQDIVKRLPLTRPVLAAAGIALAWYGASLFKVSAACCVIVFVVELGLC